MNRHPIRWESLLFGLAFLAVLGNWAVWKEDLLTGRELSLAGAVVLIVLGVVGVAATLWRPRRTAVDPQPIAPDDLTTERSDDDEEADAQP